MSLGLIWCFVHLVWGIFRLCGVITGLGRGLALCLCLLALGAEPLFLPLGLRRVFPGDAALQVIQQVFSGCLELLADHAQAQQPNAKGVFLVGRLRFRGACRPLVEGLRGDGEAELDVRLDFSGVELAVERPELHGPFLENTVEIQAAVAAVVVVGVAAVAAVIPQALELLPRGGLLLIELLQKAGVDFLAVVYFPAAGHFQRLVDHVLLRRHDVDKIPQVQGVEWGGVDVDVDAAGGVGKGAALVPELADELLHRLDVLILADGADHLHAVATIGKHLSPPFPPLAVDAPVAHEFPAPPLGVRHGVCAVVRAIVLAACAKIAGGDLSGTAAGEAGHFDLDAEVLTLDIHRATTLPHSVLEGEVGFRHKSSRFSGGVDEIAQPLPAPCVHQTAAAAVVQFVELKDRIPYTGGDRVGIALGLDEPVHIGVEDFAAPLHVLGGVVVAPGIGVGVLAAVHAGAQVFQNAGAVLAVRLLVLLHKSQNILLPVGDVFDA